MAVNLHVELARIERCIARAAAKIAHQRAIIAILVQHGLDPEMPEKVLQVLEQNLAVAEGYRALLQDAIRAAKGRDRTLSLKQVVTDSVVSSRRAAGPADAHPGPRPLDRSP